MLFFNTHDWSGGLRLGDFDRMDGEEARDAAKALFLTFCSRLEESVAGDDNQVFATDELEQAEDRGFVRSWSTQTDELGTYLRFSAERDPSPERSPSERSSGRSRST